MKVAYFLTHPIQYQVPMIRHLGAGGVDLEVFYGSDSGSSAFFDPGFGQPVQWDVPLLEGYPHTILNHEELSGPRTEQITHYRKQIRNVLKHGTYRAVWVHGWHHPFAAAAWLESQALNIPLMLRAETFLGCVQGGWFKRLAHRMIFSRRFRQVKAFLAVGTLNHQLYRAYGAPEDHIFRVPYAVDNDFFQSRAKNAHPNSETLRAELGIEPGRTVILFCGKLITVKDPATLIQAVGQLEGNPVLLIAGDGALRSDLEELADKVAPGRIKFLGFKNQTELPALYDLCDVFVLPSAFEPWGLVVNEVMNAGKPVIVSDQVGCGPDLIAPGINGDIFRAGDVADLCRKLAPYCQSPDLREVAGTESLARINCWSFSEDLTGLQQALRIIAAP
jgi:glycosyltransferase involved in cell wall biosynthesis